MNKMVQTVSTSSDQFFKNAHLELNISNERMNLLDAIANTVTEMIQKDKPVNLNFICTHNSRRSQFAQVWAYFASGFFDLPQIRSYSGGTEVTSFFRNTVRSLQQTGFDFKLIDFSHRNPVYQISYPRAAKPILGFSKRYDDSVNDTPFIAITTCDSADENCPFIPEASHRFHLPFVDPKKYDNTETQAEHYLVTSKQIASEIYFIFDKIKKSL
jgi:arsenate reductase